MSVSVYQQVKDYFFQRDLFTPEYIETECSKSLSRQQLNRHFKTHIKKHDVRKYRLRYTRNCIKSMTELSIASRTGGEFWKKVYATIMTERIFSFNTSIRWVKNLEVLLNVCWYLGSFYFPWSTYLLFYPGGQKMVQEMFSNKSSVQGIISFYCLLYTVQTNRAFDDVFFQEELLRIIPYVNLPQSILRKVGMPTSGKSWYQYITLNLVSDESLSKVTSIIDSKLTSYVLSELAVYLRDLIKESGMEDYLIEILTEISSTKTSYPPGSPITRSKSPTLRSTLPRSPRRSRSTSKRLS